MPLTRLHQKSDTEKHLKILHRQLYGKVTSRPVSQDTGGSDNKNTDTPARSSDIIYLRQDLLKIFLFSSLAIMIQLTLFFALKNGLLKLPFI